MVHGRDKYQSRRNRVEVRRVLSEHWDPIGVKDESPDEYDAYVGKVYVMLMDHQASKPDIANYLQDVATDRMGLPATPRLVGKCRDTAEVLIELRPTFGSSEPRDYTS